MVSIVFDLVVVVGSLSGAESDVSTGAELTLTSAADFADMFVFFLFGRFRIVCIVTFCSRGGISKPISSLSIRDTLASQVTVGDMEVGRVRVAVTM